jgi:hypothetical protein
MKMSKSVFNNLKIEALYMKMPGRVFNNLEIEAIIAGNKTQFREVTKIQPTNPSQVPLVVTEGSLITEGLVTFAEFSNSYEILSETRAFFCPYYEGQRIFVKEHPQTTRRESNLILDIKKVRLERLEEITEEDCIKEGVTLLPGINYEAGDSEDPKFYYGDLIEAACKSCASGNTSVSGIPGVCGACIHNPNPYTNLFDNPLDAFITHWDSTHKNPKHKFDTNPYVCVVDFIVELDK